MKTIKLLGIAVLLASTVAIGETVVFSQSFPTQSQQEQLSNQSQATEEQLAKIKREHEMERAIREGTLTLQQTLDAAADTANGRDLRLTAIHHLGLRFIRDQAAQKALKKLARDADEVIAFQAVESFRFKAKPDSETVEIMLESLKRSEAVVRWAAADVLGQFKIYSDSIPNSDLPIARIQQALREALVRDSYLYERGEANAAEEIGADLKIYGVSEKELDVIWDTRNPNPKK